MCSKSLRNSTASGVDKDLQHMFMYEIRLHLSYLYMLHFNEFSIYNLFVDLNTKSIPNFQFDFTL